MAPCGEMILRFVIAGTIGSRLKGGGFSICHFLEHLRKVTVPAILILATLAIFVSPANAQNCPPVGADTDCGIVITTTHTAQQEKLANSKAMLDELKAKTVIADATSTGNAVKAVPDGNAAVEGTVKEVTQIEFAKMIEDVKKANSAILKEISSLGRTFVEEQEKLVQEQLKGANGSPEKIQELTAKIQELAALRKAKIAEIGKNTQALSDEMFKRQTQAFEDYKKSLAASGAGNKILEQAGKPEVSVIPPVVTAPKVQGKTDHDPTLNDRMRDYVFKQLIPPSAKPTAIVPGVTSAIPQKNKSNIPKKACTFKRT